MKVSLLGSSGKMGKSMIELAHDDPGVSIANALVRPDSKYLGKDVGEEHFNKRSGLKFCAFPKENFDIFIDFSTNNQLEEKIELYKKFGKPLLFCSTGLNKDEELKIKQLSSSFPVFYAPNTSLVLNYLTNMAKKVSTSLDFSEIIIEEQHHKSKIDTPSGTAKEIAESLHIDANNILSKREGSSGNYHKIIFKNRNEEIQISHFGLNRKLYAEGAINIAKWFYQKPKNLYHMQTLIKEIYE